MISTSDFKNGMSINYKDQLYEILYFQHVKPGKGGAFVRTKLKNLNTGAITDKTFRAGEKVEKAVMDTKKMQFLYRDEHHYNFMDTKTYEQIPISKDHIGEKENFLLEDMEVSVIFYKSEPISVELPTFIEAKIIDTEPGVKGDTVNSNYKPAKIETGMTMQVPLFINKGDIIKVDTRTGEYITRISK